METTEPEVVSVVTTTTTTELHFTGSPKSQELTASYNWTSGCCSL